MSSTAEEIFLIRHAIIDGDLPLYLVWNNKTKSEETHEGGWLAERLQNLGMVDHALLIQTGETKRNLTG